MAEAARAVTARKLRYRLAREVLRHRPRLQRTTSFNEEKHAEDEHD